MDTGILGVILRVIICCIVFAFFLFVPLKSRFRLSYIKTGILVCFFVVFTLGVTILFLISGRFLSEYAMCGVLLWILAAILVFHIAIKGSYFEVAFIVLVVLNLYVNIVAIAKVIANAINIEFAGGLGGTVITIAVLIAYIPLLWILMFDLYKRVVEFQISFSFWKFLWVIPGLSYTIFYVKIINDYWRNTVPITGNDILFIILWSLTTYVFFLVTLQMLVEAYHGIIATEQMKTTKSLLLMQAGQSKRLLEDIEHTSRIRHDWRHHLLTLNSFAEKGDWDKLKEYMGGMLPEYEVGNEGSVCKNHVIDVIILHYAAIANRHQISMTVKMDVPDGINIQATDLCIIFGNLMENAVDACLCKTSEPKQIEAKAHMQGNQLVAMIKNSYEGNIMKCGDIFESTKHEGEGIGISSARRTVEKYNGLFQINYDNSEFCVNLILNAAAQIYN